MNCLFLHLTFSDHSGAWVSGTPECKTLGSVCYCEPQTVCSTGAEGFLQDTSQSWSFTMSLLVRCQLPCSVTKPLRRAWASLHLFRVFSPRTLLLWNCAEHGSREQHRTMQPRSQEEETRAHIPFTPTLHAQPTRPHPIKSLAFLTHAIGCIATLDAQLWQTPTIQSMVSPFVETSKVNAVSPLLKPSISIPKTSASAACQYVAASDRAVIWLFLRTVFK